MQQITILRRIFLSISSRLMLILIGILLIGMSSLYAQPANSGYEKWKQQQQAVDAQLKQQSTARSQADHYLSRPQMTAQLQDKNGAVLSQGKININTATVQQLQQLHGIGEKKAQAIVDYRNQHGKFKNIAELADVKGIGPKLLEKNKNLIQI